MGKVEDILLNYKQKVKKVKTTDELNELIDNTQAELEDALGTEPTPPTPPTPPTEGEGGMAEIMAAIKSLNAKVDGLITGKPQSDGTPEGDIDKAIAELGSGGGQEPPNGLDSGELLDDDVKIETEDENPINKDDKGVTSTKAPNELEDVSSIDGKELEPNEIEMDETVAKDAAVALLKSARAAIANISNPTEKRKVVDSILKSVKGLKNGSSISDVMRVKNKAKDSRTTDSAAIENAYLSQNPHMKAKLNLK